MSHNGPLTLFRASLHLLDMKKYRIIISLILRTHYIPVFLTRFSAQKGCVGLE